VGRPAHPWRIAKAWLGDRRVDHFQIHDPASRAAIANLADIPVQPCGCDRSDRSLRGSNPDLRAPNCVSRRWSRPAIAALVRGDPTRYPTAEWATMMALTGKPSTRRVRAMGIRGGPISPRSPWQNPYAERLIETLRRDCLDHVLILGERHLRRVLTLYFRY